MTKRNPVPPGSQTTCQHCCNQCQANQAKHYKDLGRFLASESTKTRVALVKAIDNIARALVCMWIFTVIAFYL